MFADKLLDHDQMKSAVKINMSINGTLNAKDPHHFTEWSLPIDELDRYLKLDLMYSPAWYRDGHRVNEKVKHGSINCIMLDFDDGMTLEEAFVIFRKYNCVIATTKSHQKEKNGIVCDRFRVLIPTKTPITLTPQEYSRFMRSAMEMYPQADKSCKNASRFYFATKTSEVHRIDGSELFDWELIHRNAKRLEAIENYSRSMLNIRSHDATTQDAAVALEKIDPDCDYDEWVDIAMALKDEFGDTGFKLWDDWSRRGSKYNEREMKNKWESFKGSGVGIGTLFHIAGAAS